MPRITASLGFGFAWLLAAVPLAWISQGIEGHISWLVARLGVAGFGTGLSSILETFGLLLLRLSASIIGPLFLALLLLLPLLSLSWNGILGCRRNPLLGFRGMIWPALLHSCLTGFMVTLVTFLFVLLEGLSGITNLSLPLELFIFFLASLGAWIVLPHAVDNLSAEWCLLVGSCAGILGMLAATPLITLSVELHDKLYLSLAIIAGCTVSGLVTGLLLPWLLTRDRPFWLEVEQDGVVRSFRLGRRPLMIGGFPQAQLQLHSAGLPSLRVSLSGLTLFIEQQGRERYEVVYPPIRIRHGDCELRLRSFDERDDWEELELSPAQQD